MPEITDPTSRLLAARLRALRTERGLSLVALAAQLPMDGPNLTAALLGRIENRTRAASVPELGAIACALGVDVEHLTRAGELCGSCGQEITR